jgi:hypothetical protein
LKSPVLAVRKSKRSLIGVDIDLSFPIRGGRTAAG